MNKYQKPKILLIGASGSGKNTVQDYLVQKHGLKPLLSYTTRNKRFPEENTHTFVTEKEYETIKQQEKIIAYTYYNGNHYFATEKQLEESDIYIIDTDGIEYLKNHSTIPFITFFLEVSELNRFNRMRDRGDPEADIQERLSYDRKTFTGNKYLYDYTIKNNEGSCSSTADTIYDLWNYEISKNQANNSMISFATYPTNNTTHVTNINDQEVIDTEREIIDKIYQIQTLMLKLNSSIEHIEINVYDVDHESDSNVIEVFGCNYEYITSNNPSQIIEFKTLTDDKTKTSYLRNITGYKHIDDVRIK